MSSSPSSFFTTVHAPTRPRSRRGQRPGSPPTRCQVGLQFANRCQRPPRIAWRRTGCARSMATPTPIDLHYQVEGPAGAPVLVLSHALGLSLAMWDPQMARLSQNLRLVRYDHRGHGGSPVPLGPYTIGDLGRDLLRLLDRLLAGTGGVLRCVLWRLGGPLAAGAGAGGVC